MTNHVATLVDLIEPLKLLPECERRLGHQDKSPASRLNESQGLTATLGQPELTTRKEARQVEGLTTFYCVYREPLLPFLNFVVTPGRISARGTLGIPTALTRNYISENTNYSLFELEDKIRFQV